MAFKEGGGEGRKEGECRRDAAVVSLKGRLLCVWGVGRRKGSAV